MARHYFLKLVRSGHSDSTKAVVSIKKIGLQLGEIPTRSGLGEKGKAAGARKSGQAPAPASASASTGRGRRRDGLFHFYLNPHLSKGFTTKPRYSFRI